MSGYGKRGDIEIAALKKSETNYNVMLPGSGTPWEDRGAAGFLAAYFKTTFQSLFSFRSLVDQIRRPETGGDANGYASLCGVMWGLGIGLWDVVVYFRALNNTAVTVDGQQFLTEAVLRAVGAGFLTIVIYKLATTIFYNLLTSDAQRQIPKVLVGNVFAYAMGPSILALIPVVGWVLAVVWIVINTIVAAKTRLYLRMRESVVNVIIAGVVSTLLLVVIYFACYFVWPLIYGQSSIAPIIVPKKTMMN
jgi:hypothetical protein